MCSFTIGGANIDWRTQHDTERRDSPKCATTWSGDLVVIQALGNAVKREMESRVGVPREDLLYDGGRDRIDLETMRVSRMFRIEQVPIRSTAPGKELPAPQLCKPSSSHPVGNQLPFILGDSTSHLEQELVMRVVTHGTVNKDDLTATLMQFLDQEDLMDVLAGKSVGCRQENDFEGSEEGMVAQPIKTRTIECGAAVPVVAIDMLLVKMPGGL